MNEAVERIWIVYCEEVSNLIAGSFLSQNVNNWANAPSWGSGRCERPFAHLSGDEFEGKFVVSRINVLCLSGLEDLFSGESLSAFEDDRKASFLKKNSQ